MAIGRSEDRDTRGTLWCLDITIPVWDPIRVTHLGQRSFDRTTQAGHMIATDQSHRSCNVPARRGPSRNGFRCRWPAQQGVSQLRGIF